MKRIILYIIVLLTLPMTAGGGTDIGRLIPAEMVWVDCNDGSFAVVLDTGDVGSGDTVERALADLEHGAPGVVFLDTAEYLMVTEAAEACIPELLDHLKGNVRVCRGDQTDLAAAAAYLDAHRPNIRLKEWQSGTDLQELKWNKGHFEIS